VLPSVRADALEVVCPSLVAMCIWLMLAGLAPIGLAVECRHRSPMQRARRKFLAPPAICGHKEIIRLSTKPVSGLDAWQVCAVIITLAKCKGSMHNRIAGMQ